MNEILSLHEVTYTYTPEEPDTRNAVDRSRFLSTMVSGLQSLVIMVLVNPQWRNS